MQFAIIRAGYRGSVTGSLVEDPMFVTNMKGAQAAGIPVGVYFFTQAVDEKEAVEEASAVIELIRDYRLNYPVFIDTEGAGGNGRADSLDAEDRKRCNVKRSADLRPVVPLSPVARYKGAATCATCNFPSWETSGARCR